MLSGAVGRARCGDRRKAERKKRWCAGCGKAEGAGLLKTQNLCEGCGLKRKNYGLVSEGKRRWCAGCGKAEGAVRIKQGFYGVADDPSGG